LAHGILAVSGSVRCIKFAWFGFFLAFVTELIMFPFVLDLEPKYEQFVFQILEVLHRLLASQQILGVKRQGNPKLVVSRTPRTGTNNKVFLYLLI